MNPDKKIAAPVSPSTHTPAATGCFTAAQLNRIGQAGISLRAVDSLGWHVLLGDIPSLMSVAAVLVAAGPAPFVPSRRSKGPGYRHQTVGKH